MNIADDLVILKVKKLLQGTELPINKIFLFGSRAKQTFHPDSDYDFLILVKNIEDKEELKIYKRKINFLIRNEIPDTSFDLIIKNESEFEENKESINTLLNEIYEEGILI